MHRILYNVHDDQTDHPTEDIFEALYGILNQSANQANMSLLWLAVVRVCRGEAGPKAGSRAQFCMIYLNLIGDCTASVQSSALTVW